jgi:hypothetical protein
MSVANIVRTKMGMEMDNAIIIGIAAGCCQREFVFYNFWGLGKDFSVKLILNKILIKLWQKSY